MPDGLGYRSLGYKYRNLSNINTMTLDSKSGLGANPVQFKTGFVANRFDRNRFLFKPVLCKTGLVTIPNRFSNCICWPGLPLAGGLRPPDPPPGGLRPPGPPEVWPSYAPGWPSYAPPWGITCGPLEKTTQICQKSQKSHQNTVLGGSRTGWPSYAPGWPSSPPRMRIMCRPL